MADTDLHAFVSNYNWDDGLGAIRPIVDSAATDFATALMIYWRLEGPWLEHSSTGPNDEARQLQQLVKERLLAGWYRKTSLEYFPVVDLGLGAMQIHKLKKAGVPSDLIEPTYA